MFYNENVLVERKAEDIGQGQSTRLYEPAWGWLDGVHVKGEHSGDVVPVQLSLDQGMIALSAAQMMAPDLRSVSGHALTRHKTVRKRLENFYKILDNKLVKFTN